MEVPPKHKWNMEVLYGQSAYVHPAETKLCSQPTRGAFQGKFPSLQRVHSTFHVLTSQTLKRDETIQHRTPCICLLLHFIQKPKHLTNAHIPHYVSMQITTAGLPVAPLFPRGADTAQNTAYCPVLRAACHT